MNVRKCSVFGFAFSVLQFCALLVYGQTPAGNLHGQVSDPSGAAIPNAKVVLTPSAAGSTPIPTQANGQGQYEFKGLAPGQYTLNVVAPGFSVYENDNVVVPANQALLLNVPMGIEVEQQKIQVEDTAPTLDVNPSNNAGSLTGSCLPKNRFVKFASTKIRSRPSLTKSVTAASKCSPNPAVISFTGSFR